MRNISPSCWGTCTQKCQVPEHKYHHSASLPCLLWANIVLPTSLTNAFHCADPCQLSSGEETDFKRDKAVDKLVTCWFNPLSLALTAPSALAWSCPLFWGSWLLSGLSWQPMIYLCASFSSVLPSAPLIPSIFKMFLILIWYVRTRRRPEHFCGCVRRLEAAVTHQAGLFPGLCTEK